MKPCQDPDGRASLLLSLLLLAGLAALTPLIRPLIPIDETRYVSVAWEMWLRGDFLVPFKNGAPYSHKPPFMFWVFHLGWALFGVNEWWPRMVSPVFSAGALALTFLLARRLWPHDMRIAGSAALVLTGSLLWMLFSTLVMFDVLLAFWVLVGMHGVITATEGKWSGFLMLGVAIGLGALTKGPVILLHLLPLAALAPWWNPGLRWPRWYGGVVVAVLLGAAIALAWALPAGMAGGDAFRDAIFWGQTADRMVGSFAHERPIWWYLPLLPIILFPWSLWPGLWRSLARHQREGVDRGTRFCLAWILPVFIAFSLISGKQVHYLIPLLPAFALLAARVLAGQPTSRVGVPALLAAVLGVMLLLAGSGLVTVLADRIAQPPPLWPGGLLVLVAVLAWVAGRRAIQPVLTLGLLGVASLTLVQVAASRSVGSLYDVRPMALAIKKAQAQGLQVANAATYHAQYQFLGRLEAPLFSLRPADFAGWLADHPEGHVVIYLEGTQKRSEFPARHKQAYGRGTAVLVDAQTAAGLLTAEGWHSD